MKVSDHRPDLAVLHPRTVSARPAESFAAVKNFEAVALNPQPLPPKEGPFGAAKATGITGNLDAVALNPQPLPPKEVLGGLGAGAVGKAVLRMAR